MAIADVTVFGAGIFGLSVGWACAARGAKVQVIDPAGPGAGASGGLVGALAPHAPDQWDNAKAFQFEALAMADLHWAKIAGASRMNPGYARHGRLQPLKDEGAVALARTRSSAAADLWQGRFRWDVIEAATVTGFAPLSPSGWLIRDGLSARINPRRALAALTAAIVARGGEIRQEGRPAGRVVEATGHTGLAAAGLGGGVKGQAALLDLAVPRAPQIYGGSIHVVPHGDGTVAIGSTSEKDWRQDGPDSQIDAVIARATALVPALAGAGVIERWAGIRPRATSRQPLLGVHPDGSGRFIANGGFKTGFGLAPLVGEVMADLVLDGHDRIPPGFRARGG